MASMYKQSGQYLTFKLAEEVFAVDIGMVREVVELPVITRIPRTPDFLCGVINLRGHAVPVVDMRVKFGLPEGARTVNTCIIVVELSWNGECHAIGALVDSVQEVRELAQESITVPPQIGTADADCISAMGRNGDSFILVLDMSKVLSAEELVKISGVKSDVHDDVLR